MNTLTINIDGKERVFEVEICDGKSLINFYKEIGDSFGVDDKCITLIKEITDQPKETTEDIKKFFESDTLMRLITEKINNASKEELIDTWKLLEKPFQPKEVKSNCSDEVGTTCKTKEQKQEFPIVLEKVKSEIKAIIELTDFMADTDKEREYVKYLLIDNVIKAIDKLKEVKNGTTKQ